MIVLLICRANTVDHPSPAVAGAYFREGGYPVGRPPRQKHSHSDAPDFPCVPVFGTDEDIPAAYPHDMRDGTSVADANAYLTHLLRYVP